MEKKTLGRRRIEMKKIQKKTNLQVTFSKRRTGLFKKAMELSVLCGARIAILAMSPAGKVYSFGEPSVVNSFLTADVPPPPIINSAEKSTAECWWNQSVEGLQLPQLEEYLKALETLASNAYKRADEKEVDDFFNFSASTSQLFM